MTTTDYWPGLNRLAFEKKQLHIQEKGMHITNPIDAKFSCHNLKLEAWLNWIQEKEGHKLLPLRQ